MKARTKTTRSLWAAATAMSFGAELLEVRPKGYGEALFCLDDTEGLATRGIDTWYRRTAVANVADVAGNIYRLKEAGAQSVRGVKNVNTERGDRTGSWTPDSGGLLWGKEIDEMAYPQWVIDQIIPAASVSMLYGKSGSGKSFWGLDWALPVSSGKGKWNGRAVKQGPVVYVAGEGKSGYAARIQAWEKQNKMQRGEFGLYTRPVRSVEAA